MAISNGVPSETATLYAAATPDGGVVRLARWPEGFVLWYHGEIVWRSWKPNLAEAPQHGPRPA